ncbi:hypothetical protein G6F46_014144 [Rhizopus delemar]|nr:hypothetical protein G6F46_014144 [Rhizopus delemar]
MALFRFDVQAELPVRAITTQYRETDWAFVTRLLAEAGTDKTKILMAQIYVANMKEFAGMNKAWDAWGADGNSPPRATVEARLANPDFKVEIVVTAAV